MRRFLGGFSIFAVGLTASACAISAPTAPESVTISTVPESPYRGAAFVADISTLQRRVSVSAPTGLPTSLIGGSAMISLPGGGQSSLLGADAIDMIASNYSSGAVGATVPGKVLITFDLTVINRLKGLRLITPTFPTPPASVSGIQVFPLEVTTISRTGTATGAGNTVSVQTPRYGEAVASNDWDGPPHNFFGSGACTPSTTSCYRYESFGPLESQTASPARRVGFLVDPTVGDVRVRIIVAADLQVAPR